MGGADRMKRNDAALRERSETQMVEYGTRMRRERDEARAQRDELGRRVAEFFSIAERLPHIGFAKWFKDVDAHRARVLEVLTDEERATVGL